MWLSWETQLYQNTKSYMTSRYIKDNIPLKFIRTAVICVITLMKLTVRHSKLLFSKTVFHFTSPVFTSILRYTALSIIYLHRQQWVAGYHWEYNNKCVSKQNHNVLLSNHKKTPGKWPDSPSQKITNFAAPAKGSPNHIHEFSRKLEIWNIFLKKLYSLVLWIRLNYLTAWALQIHRFCYQKHSTVVCFDYNRYHRSHILLIIWLKFIKSLW